jgi:hypothetical protein
MEKQAVIFGVVALGYVVDFVEMIEAKAVNHIHALA